MKASDYIASFFASHGVDTVFMVTGGGAMHLNDSFAKSPDFSVYYFHHEQAAAMAAEGYARVTGRPCVLNVTSGPGALNLPKLIIASLISFSVKSTKDFATGSILFKSSPSFSTKSFYFSPKTEPKCVFLGLV